MTILLTGATSGIGLELLCQFHNRGDKIYAVGRDFETLNKSLDPKSKNLVLVKFDLTNVAEISKIFNLIEENNDKLDGFVNCAGYEETIPLKQFDYIKAKFMFDVNVFSTIEILRFFSLKKYSKENASIVLISSVMGFLGQAGKVGYCSSKSAINGIVKSAALELAARKIRINSISPGMVNTNMAHKLFLQLGENKKYEIIQKHPLGVSEPTDIAPAVFFLLSEGAKKITGIDLIIDGGYSIQ